VVATCLGLLWGLLQGVRHAIEPDHLAAVSTLVAQRRGERPATAYAAAWGAGHAAVLLAVGGGLFLLRARLPGRVAAGFELCVALVLVLLGSRALRGSLRAVRPDASPRPAHPGSRAAAGQPLLVGCVHGLAGSGAVAAVVGAQMPSAVAGLAYLVLYGGGAALGMAMLAGAAGVPLAWLLRTRRGFPALLATTGSVSLVLGIAWGWSAARPALLP